MRLMNSTTLFVDKKFIIVLGWIVQTYMVWEAKLEFEINLTIFDILNIMGKQNYNILCLA